MPTATLTKKLQVKAGQRLAFINEPANWLDVLGDLPEGALVADASAGALDFVQLFVKDRSELDRLSPTALQAITNDGLLWICYPKGSSKVKTDLNRDLLWAAMLQFGYEGVTLIAIDEIWSAMRFRPVDRVRT